MLLLLIVWEKLSKLSPQLKTSAILLLKRWFKPRMLNKLGRCNRTTWFSHLILRFWRDFELMLKWFTSKIPSPRIEIITLKISFFYLLFEAGWSNFVFFCNSFDARFFDGIDGSNEQDYSSGLCRLPTHFHPYFIVIFCNSFWCEIFSGIDSFREKSSIVGVVFCFAHSLSSLRSFFYLLSCNSFDGCSIAPFFLLYFAYCISVHIWSLFCLTFYSCRYKYI